MEKCITKKELIIITSYICTYLDKAKRVGWVNIFLFEAGGELSLRLFIFKLNFLLFGTRKLGTKIYY